MSFVLEARHWVIMIGVVILAAAALVFAPQAVAIYPVTTYAFPIIAVAVILDTLGTAAERHRAPLKLLAWVCLCAATLTALTPLRGPLSDILATVQAWTGAGWPLPVPFGRDSRGWRGILIRRNRPWRSLSHLGPLAWPSLSAPR